jgi:hypothetical protein
MLGTPEYGELLLLFLHRAKPEETLVEACSDSDVRIEAFSMQKAA